jgi:hypothetical protein
MRHIALGGMSFCGSTVMSYLLGSLPGAANIGESHWLVDVTKAGERIFCAHCGPKCAVLTEEFRQSLKTDPNEWYARIAAQLETDLLVSSDKAPVLLDRLDPDRKYDLVVLYKPPGLHARSYARVMQKNGTPVDILRYLDQWSNFYERYLDKFEIDGLKTFVDVDRFFRTPEQQLKNLAAVLGIPFDAAALEYWRRVHHQVGGNFNPYTRLANDPRSLPIVPLTAHAVEDDLLAQIAFHARSQEVHQRLAGQRLAKRNA